MELASVVHARRAGLKNLSGQTYRAVIIPTSTVIEKAVLARLQAFAAAGGKVIFVGRTPTMVVDQNFLHAGGPPDLSFATLVEPTPNITDRVVAALPPPDCETRHCLSAGQIYPSAVTRTAKYISSSTNPTRPRRAPRR
jgi:beta-galactosidase GanA